MMNDVLSCLERQSSILLIIKTSTGQSFVNHCDGPGWRPQPFGARGDICRKQKTQGFPGATLGSPSILGSPSELVTQKWNEWRFFGTVT